MFKQIGWAFMAGGLFLVSPVLGDEIHLMNGKIITTSECREENGMVIYRKGKGEISLSEDQVKKVVYSRKSEGFLPEYVYHVKYYKAAQDEALKNKKALTFIFVDPDTTCRLAKGATLDVVRELKQYSVIVYVKPQRDWKISPDEFKSAVSSEATGQYIPKTIVFDHSLKNVLAIIPYASQQKRTGLIRKAKEAILAAKEK